MTDVTLTQADRIAAWSFANFGHMPDSQERRRWHEGYYDNHPVGAPILAFARHRTAHSGEGRESVSAPTQRMEKALGAKFVATGKVERLRAAMKQAEIHIDCASFRKAQDILLAALAQSEGAKSD